MTRVSEYIIRSVRAAICRERLSAPEGDFLWEEYYQWCRKNSVAGIVWYALAELSEQIPPEICQKFSGEQAKGIFVDMKQQAEIAVFFAELDKEKLPYMPLKGYFLKQRYPSPDMRYMCDLDVLIRMERHAEYEEILKRLGYTFLTESPHELVYQKPPLMNVELHKSIVPDYETEYYAYYQDGWSFARSCPDSSCFVLGEEDFFIFLIIHLAKHYRHEGIGIRHFIDIYLLQSQLGENFDHNYFQKQLSELRMTEFYQSVCELLAVWFEHAPATEKTEMMTRYIIQSGTNGELQTRNAHLNFYEQETGQSQKMIILKKNLRLMFPTLKQLKKSFPVLEKYPFLYPVLSIYRLFRGVTFRQERAKEMLKKTNVGNRYDYQSIKTHFQTVGLLDEKKEKKEGSE